MNNNSGGRKVAIIGAGFSGLTLATYLEKTKASSCWTYQLFDSKEDPIPIIGTIQLPNANIVLDELHLLTSIDIVNEIFPKNIDDNNFVDVSREAFLNLLRKQVTIESNCRIVDVVQARTCGGNNNSCLFNVVTENGKQHGTFDLVVIADGLFGDQQTLRNNKCIAARLGDCRWISQRRYVWWDFGTTRIKQGADIAVQDGIELGRKLVHHNINSNDLGDFASPSSTEMSKRNKQKKMMYIVLFPLLLSIIYHVIQQFERI
jgi:hypothetical protein